jgi:hypothetical protein
MTFSVSTPRQEVGASVLVQAALNVPLDNSTYFVRLYDKTAGTILKECTGGTYCSVFVTRSNATTHVYGAHLDRGRGGSAPYPVAAVAEKSVSWVVIPNQAHWRISPLSAGKIDMQDGSLTVSRDGTWQFTGSVHDNSTWYGDNYAIAFVFNGLGHGGGAEGSLGAKYSGPPVNGTFNVGGKDPWIAANYNQIYLTNTLHTTLHVDGDFGQLAGAVWDDLKPYAGTAVTWLAGCVLV